MTKFHKMLAIVLLGGLGGGLAWAFISELYLDATVKRAKDIETKLGLRLFLSIPDNRDLVQPITNGFPGAKNCSWDALPALHPYYEVLCDRMFSYFKVRNLHHKSKLVAVTGVSRAAGASTIALGLATSLSDTGNGKVLLVNMNSGRTKTQEFYQGKSGCDLEAALGIDTRDSALVQGSLYVVAEGSKLDQLPRVLSRRVADLIPRLKASDYDYIIFDLPTISQTSATLRIVGFMDLVLLVAESEKTNREAVRRANALLTEAQATVGVVLNKVREYIPARLIHEY